MIRTIARVVYLQTILTPSSNIKLRLAAIHPCEQNPEEEKRYVTTFNVREYVLMDRDAIRPNAAKSGIA